HVQGEIVAALFGVGLVALKIVDTRGDEFAGFSTGTNGVDGVADHLKGFKGDHHFVVFDVIADEHENRFFGHGGLRRLEVIGCTERDGGSSDRRGRKTDRKNEKRTKERNSYTESTEAGA